MAATDTAQINHERVEELTRVELAALNERTERSAQMYERARKSLSGGVASSYQLRDPWPIYLVSGEGAQVTDVDGNRTGTSTTASARWCRAMPTPRSSPLSPSAPDWARISPP